MKEYLSHFSAAAFWNISYIRAVLGAEVIETNPMDFTVSERSSIYQKKGRTIHLCQTALPSGAVVSINGKRVASPELVFLELADKLDIHRLILFGLQLCSNPKRDLSGPITTKQKIEAFLMKTPGHQGHHNAVRAVKYIEDSSASVMESIVYMILTLPHALGGYGLDGAVFNYEIQLKGEAGKRLGQQRCFLDLYYRQAKLAVEYDSFAFHNSPLKQGKDTMRSAVLDRHGIQVMHMSTIQLYDEGACMDFAFNLASRLGKRVQIRTKKFGEMHTLLRTLLPDGSSIAESEPKDKDI